MILKVHMICTIIIEKKKKISNLYDLREEFLNLILYYYMITTRVRNILLNQKRIIVSD